MLSSSYYGKTANTRRTSGMLLCRLCGDRLPTLRGSHLGFKYTESSLGMSIYLLRAGDGLRGGIILS